MRPEAPSSFPGARRARPCTALPCAARPCADRPAGSQRAWIAAATLCAALAALSAGCLIAAAGGAGAAAGAAGSDPERNTGNVIADAYVTSAVKTALAAAKGVQAHTINVDTRKGMVTLRGTVRSAEEARRAVEVTRSVAGVKGVKSKLTVAGG